MSDTENTNFKMFYIGIRLKDDLSGIESTGFYTTEEEAKEELLDKFEGWQILPVELNIKEDRP